MPSGKPALAITFGEDAAEYARVLAKELKGAGFPVRLAQGFKFLGTFGAGTGANNWVEIHQALTDAWMVISPFIPYIVKALKNAVQAKRRKRDETITRVRVSGAKDAMVIDFNDHQIAKREPDPEKPMAVPAVSEMIEVPQKTERKKSKTPAKKKKESAGKNKK